MEEHVLVDRVRALAPMVAEHAREAEEARQPVDSVMQALEDAGVYRYFVPKKYGGY